MMSIQTQRLKDVIRQARESIERESARERLEVLKNAKILNSKGEYRSGYFTKETIKGSKSSSSEETATTTA